MILRKVSIGEVLKLSPVLLSSKMVTMFVFLDKMSSVVPSLIDMLMFSTKIETDIITLSTKF
jgi:hypothetical protein